MRVRMHVSVCVSCFSALTIVNGQDMKISVSTPNETLPEITSSLRSSPVEKGCEGLTGEKKKRRKRENGTRKGGRNSADPHLAESHRRIDVSLSFPSPNFLALFRSRSLNSSYSVAPSLALFLSVSPSFSLFRFPSQYLPVLLS